MSTTAWNPDGPIIVRKYGGSSLADIPRLRVVAADLRRAREAGQRLVVVVSAMGDQTDDLVRMAQQANPEPPRRELDMLLTVGERISMSLLCMALAAEGVPAVSFTGSQVGIITDAGHTDARITEVKAYRIGEALAAGKMVVVAGFQGYCAESRDITTLGRGGSDTTAVALAHALDAERCEILKDVPGVMTADPKLLAGARRFDRLDFDQMQAIADAGSCVVHPRAVAYAARHGVVLHVGSSFEPGPGTIIAPAPARAPEAPPAAAWRPLALVLAEGQASLLLESARLLPDPALPALAARATSVAPLTAEWFDASGDRWSWEGWGQQRALGPVAAAAAAATAHPECPGRCRWQPDQAVLTLAGRRPESWSAALRDLRQLVHAKGGEAVRLRTDGQAVRLLGPPELLAALAPCLHELVRADGSAP